jgi:hypothetical protein
MKNFQEKEIKDLSSVTGGSDGTLTIGFTVDPVGFFDGIKGNEKLKFDKIVVANTAN